MVLSAVAFLGAACAGGSAAPSSRGPAALTLPAPAPGTLNAPALTPTLSRPRGRTPTPSPVVTLVPATATIAVGRTQVEVGDYYFSPPVVTITVGTTITWVPVGTVVHTILSTDSPPAFRGGTSGAGSPVFRHTFSSPGTYAYYCDYHPDEMDAWVVVIAGS